MVNLSKLAFWGGVNYMKRNVVVGYEDFTLGAFATVAITVTHDLGFIPHYEVHGQRDGFTRNWARNRPYVGMGDFTGTPTEPEVQDWIDENHLTIQMTNPSGSTISRRQYYLIYKDYGA